ncbi:MAG: DinB family protein [Actinobacteria bacterium]|nr:MAG: DinB family protein [Actinomycetota bacterium]
MMARRGEGIRPYTAGMPDPTLSAAREIVEESIDGFRDAISRLSADALNWRPSKEGTNPIAVLAVHAMHSTRSWLAVAVGAPLPDRDRDAEFRTVVGGSRELIEIVDRLAADRRALLTTEDAFEPGTMRESHLRASSGRAEVVSGAWALLHAVEHLREHMGHAQLTRQLWEERAG